MALTLWGTEISYDEKTVSLLEFSMFLEQRAKKSASDFLNIGIQKKLGWLIPGTAFLEEEMLRVCDDVTSYITEHDILAVPNWNMFLEPWVTIAENSKLLMLTLNKALIADCTNEVREQANQAYRNSMANSEGLGFGIISNSLAAHFIYAMQAAEKEAKNKRAAEKAASAVWDKSNPVAKANELTIKTYHETHEPFVLDTLANFYTNVESFIYIGAGYDKKIIDEQIRNAKDILTSSSGDVHNEIVQALGRNICCGEAVLFAIKNGLVDDGFIEFCNHAPVILLKKSVGPIVDWLAKEKRVNQLYNRPIFNEKTRNFLDVVQKIYLCCDKEKHELYAQILDGAFAEEINYVYTACYDLFHGQATIEQRTEKGSHISISNDAVVLLCTLCNEVRCSKLIELIHRAELSLPIEASAINILVANINKTIDERHAEILRIREETEKKKADEIKKAAEKEAQMKILEKQKTEKALKISIVTAIMIVLAVVAISVCSKMATYSKAMEMKENGQFTSAAIAFGKMGDYKDAKEQSYILWNEVAQRNTLATSGAHTVGLRSNGTLVAAGRNYGLLDEYLGQCNVSNWTDIVAIDTGKWHTVGLKADGTVVAVGGNRNYSSEVDTGQCNVTGWTDVVAIAAGSDFTVGLINNGTVIAVGNNEHGQCNTSGWSDIISIALGQDYTVGLKKDGTVVAVGSEYLDLWGTYAGQCEVSGWTDIVAIAVGDEHTVGLKSNGNVVAVGDNEYGQCNVSGWADVITIVASGRHTVGLKSNGTVIAVGSNYDIWNDHYYGQCEVSKWTDIVTITASDWHTVGLKSDGTVVATGNNEYGQCNVSEWRDIVAIVAGWDCTFGLKSDGTVVACGRNEYGECDVLSWTDIRMPE